MLLLRQAEPGGITSETPEETTEETPEETPADTTEFAATDTNSDGELSQEELEARTVAQLRSLAEELNITLTATTKAEIIAEILAAQAAPSNEGDNQEQPSGT